ncbi:hypothetical protein ABZ820_12670 [Streptomyces diacarni]|uniref:hypothetical protein n=1 Tax=Streptomyces diacarni TaxID=2800381 RepID=UPI0033C582F3
MTTTATTPDEVTADGITVKTDGPGKWTVERGRDMLGVIWDEGPEMSRGRYATWAPHAGTRNGNAGFFHDAGDAVAAIVQTWPVTAAEVAEQAGAPVADVLAAAEALTAEWEPAGRRAVLRIASATGEHAKMIREAAAAVRERLAAPASPREVHRETYRGAELVITHHPAGRRGPVTYREHHRATVDGRWITCPTGDVPAIAAKLRKVVDKEGTDAELLPKLLPLVDGRETGHGLTPIDGMPALGDVLYVWGHGRYRRGVVTKVARKRVTVSYATNASRENRAVWHKADTVEYLRR